MAQNGICCRLLTSHAVATVISQRPRLAGWPIAVGCTMQWLQGAHHRLSSCAAAAARKQAGRQLQQAWPLVGVPLLRVGRGPSGAARQAAPRAAAAAAAAAALASGCTTAHQAAAAPDLTKAAAAAAAAAVAAAVVPAAAASSGSSGVGRQLTRLHSLQSIVAQASRRLANALAAHAALATGGGTVERGLQCSSSAAAVPT